MRNIEQHNINEWFFDLIEGNLSKVEESQLYSFIDKNKAYQKDLDLWLGTVYTAPSTIEFPNQASLLRKQNFFVQYGKFLLPLLLIGGVTTYYLLPTSANQDVNSTEKSKGNIQSIDYRGYSEQIFVMNNEKLNIIENNQINESRVNNNKALTDQRSFESIENIKNKGTKFTPIESEIKRELKLVKTPKSSKAEVASKGGKKKNSSEADVIEIENSGF